MTSDWKECKISDIANVIDSLHQTPKSYSDNGYPMIRVTDVCGGYLTFDSALKVDEETYNIFTKKYKPQVGDMIFSRVGTYGNISFVNKHIPFCLGQNVALIHPNIESKYLYYFLLSPDAKHQIESMAVGSTQKTVSLKNINNIQIKIPSLETQRKMARVLGVIDDKIELNNSINKNLEQQAQAIFKSWFIDFEPFGGTMPDDWNMGTIADLGQVIGGGTPSKNNKEYYTNNGIAWITPKDLSKNKNKFISNGDIDITDIGYKNSSTVLMPRGTVLFSSRAPIGYIAIAKNNVTTNQGFKSVIPKKEIGTAYVYYYLKQNTDKIENMASGSTFKEVSGSILKSVSAIVPNYNILTEFELFCNPIFKQQEYLEFENERLAQLRDTLLPKLMNGEIDVDKIIINQA